MGPATAVRPARGLLVRARLWGLSGQGPNTHFLYFGARSAGQERNGRMGTPPYTEDLVCKRGPNALNSAKVQIHFPEVLAKGP